MLRYPWDEWLVFNMLASSLVCIFYLSIIENKDGADAHEPRKSGIRLIQAFVYILGQLDYATLFHGPPAKTHQLGRLAIIKMNVISLCAVVAVRQFVDDILYCFVVIAFTMQIHAMRQVFWLFAYDFGFSDVLWIASLQIGIAITKELTMLCCVLLLCIVLDYYRYSFYQRSTTPLNHLTSKLSGRRS